MLAGWENFAVISGSAAGALTGLLFVAVSLNRDRIVGHAALRSEAGQTLVLFLLALLLSLLLVIPGTSPRLLGIVLVVVAVVSGAILIIIGRGKDDAARGEARKRPEMTPAKRPRTGWPGCRIRSAPTWSRCSPSRSPDPSRSLGTTACTGSPPRLFSPWAAASSMPGCSSHADTPGALTRPAR